MTDPAIVQAPFGPEVDGRRLLAEAVGFGRALRAARLHIDIGAAVDFARALTLVDIGDREQVRSAGEAIFVRRRTIARCTTWSSTGGGASGTGGRSATSSRHRCPARTPPPKRRRRTAPPSRSPVRTRRSSSSTSGHPRSCRRVTRATTTATSRASSSPPTPTARARSCAAAAEGRTRAGNLDGLDCLIGLGDQHGVQQCLAQPGAERVPPRGVVQDDREPSAVPADPHRFGGRLPAPRSAAFSEPARELRAAEQQRVRRRLGRQAAGDIEHGRLPQQLPARDRRPRRPVDSRSQSAECPLQPGSPGNVADRNERVCPVAARRVRRASASWRRSARAGRGWAVL